MNTKILKFKIKMVSLQMLDKCSVLLYSCSLKRKKFQNNTRVNIRATCEFACLCKR